MCRKPFMKWQKDKKWIKKEENAALLCYEMRLRQVPETAKREVLIILPLHFPLVR